MASRTASAPASKQGRKHRQVRHEGGKQTQALAKMDLNLSRSAVKPTGSTSAPAETLPPDDAISTHTQLIASNYFSILRATGKAFIDLLYHTDLEANLKGSSDLDGANEAEKKEIMTSVRLRL